MVLYYKGCVCNSSSNSFTGWILFIKTKYKRFIFLVTLYSMLAVFLTIDITFIINAFQFGMDQLHDSPTEDSILFIHWYVWIYYACTLLTEIPWNLFFYEHFYFSFKSLQISGVCIYFLILAAILSLLIFSLYVVHYRKVLFLQLELILPS